MILTSAKNLSLRSRVVMVIPELKKMYHWMHKCFAHPSQKNMGSGEIGSPKNLSLRSGVLNPSFDQNKT